MRHSVLALVMVGCSEPDALNVSAGEYALEVSMMGLVGHSAHLQPDGRMFRYNDADCSGAATDAEVAAITDAVNEARLFGRGDHSHLTCYDGFSASFKLEVVGGPSAGASHAFRYAEGCTVGDWDPALCRLTVAAFAPLQRICAYPGPGGTCD